jgi:hypothetical protein
MIIFLCRITSGLSVNTVSDLDLLENTVRSLDLLFFVLDNCSFVPRELIMGVNFKPQLDIVSFPFIVRFGL